MNFLGKKLLLRNASVLLLFAQVFLIVSSIWWTNNPHEQPVFTLIYTVLFCAAGYTLSQSKNWLRAYIPLSLVAIVFSAHSGNTLHIWIHALAIMTIQTMFFFAIIRHSFFRLHVPRLDRILAGVAGYILLGLFWHTQMALLISLETNPLINQLTEATPSLSDSLYFTFVTLTTLGYGDIVPITPAAKIIVLFTSLTGTLYLAIFISSLIAKSDD